MSFNENWGEYTLKEISTLKRGYDLPKSKRFNGNFPILASNGIVGYHNQFKVEGPGVTTGRSGTLGKVFYIKDNFWPLNTSLYVKDFHGNDEGFIYYYLQTLDFKNYNGGSSVPTLNRNHIHTIRVKIPSLLEQKSISAILFSLDGKIELNNQINKNLEEMAQAIFKHWFLDFEFPNESGDPYKSSGGEIVDNEMGPIPKGWEIANFNAFANEISNGDWGKALASDNYEKKVYCMRGADIPEISEGKKGKMPLRYILEKNLNKKVLCAGDLVIEISGGSPIQSTGRVTYINQEILSRYDTKLICSNFCKVIKLINKDYCEYLFLYLRYLYELNIFFNFENGTTGIKNLDIKNLFEKYKIKVPDELTIIKFRKIIKGLFRKIQKNGDENNKLSSLRDVLLPKLMSGEIRVSINSKVLIR